MHSLSKWKPVDWIIDLRRKSWSYGTSFDYPERRNDAPINGSKMKNVFFSHQVRLNFSQFKLVCHILTVHTAEFRFSFTILISNAGELRTSVIWAVAAEGHPIEEGFAARIGCAGAISVVGAVSEFALDAFSHGVTPDTLRLERI